MAASWAARETFWSPALANSKPTEMLNVEMMLNYLSVWDVKAKVS